MSTNLATILVGLGYDLSALEKGAPEAFRIVNQQTLGLSAEMKRSSREGAESLRLIDEALGVHLSRPLTRILTQEFPGLAKGLQSILGVGVFGALAVAGVEFFDKIAKGIEHAKKTEEDFTKSIEHTEDVIGDLAASHTRTMKEIGLQLAEQQGAPGAKIAAVEFHIDTAAIADAKKQIDELTKAFEDQSNKAREASKWYNEVGAALAFVVDNFFSSSASEEEHAQKKFDEFRRALEEIARTSAADPLAGLRESLQRVNQELSTTGADISAKMEAIARAQSITIATGLHGAGRAHPDSGVNKEALATEKQYFELLTQEAAAMQRVLDEDSARRHVAADAAARDALNQERAAIEAAAAATEHWTDKLIKAHQAAVPPKDQFAQFDAAVQAATIHYTNLYNAIGQQAFFVRFHESLQQVIKDMAQLAGASITAPELKLPKFTGTTAPGIAPAAPVLPQLAGGGTVGAQFDTFAKDQGAQLKAAAAAYADVITPQQKYQLAQRELNLLLQEGLIDQTAYTAALAKASEGLVQAADKVHKMQEELQKLLERSSDARAGVQAFFLQLEVDAAQNGKFAFELLNSGLKGFEDNVTQAIFTGKAHWKDYFRSLTEEVFKFLLNKEVAGFFQTVAGTGIGKSLGLTSLIPGVGQGASLTAAAGTLQAGSTTLLAASTELQAAASTMLTGSVTRSAGAGAGAGDFLSAIPGIPGFAGGTDFAPGGFAWVGEQGPELLNLPRGSSVTPAGKMGRGDTHLYQDFRGAVVTSDLMTRAEFARGMAQARPGIVGEAVANAAEIAKRSLQQR